MASSVVHCLAHRGGPSCSIAEFVSSAPLSAHSRLKVAFDLFDYDTAATIIIAIFPLVLAVEQVSNWVRRKII
jgi:hypothetical protein